MAKLIVFIIFSLSSFVSAQQRGDKLSGRRHLRDDNSQELERYSVRRSRGNPMPWWEQQRREFAARGSNQQRLSAVTPQMLARENRAHVMAAFPVTLALLNVVQYETDGEAGDPNSVIAVVIPGGSSEMDRRLNFAIDLSDTDLSAQALDVFAQVAARRFRGQNVLRFVMASGNGIGQIQANVRARLVAEQTNRLSEQIIEHGGARVYRLFVGVHQNHRAYLTRRLMTLLGGTSGLGLHSGSGASNGQAGLVAAIEATPSTRRSLGSPRAVSRLEGLELVEQGRAHESAQDFQSGIYVITGEAANLSELPMIDLNHQRLSDEQIVVIHRFWSSRLNRILGSGNRYVGQVGNGPDGTRLIIDRFFEHQIAPVEHPLNRRNLAVTQMNQQGETARSHILAFNVDPQDLNVIEALGILVTGAARRQNGLNSNVGNRAALERVQSAISAANSENSDETSLEFEQQSSNSPPLVLEQTHRTLFPSSAATSASAL